MSVPMQSVKHHTYDAIERPPGTVYDVDEAFVETVIALGMAIRVPEKPEPKPVVAKKPAK